MHTVPDASFILETYSLEELFELNDLTEEDVLTVLMQHGHIHIPEFKPLEFEND